MQNIRPTSVTTMFFLDSGAAMLADWLCSEHGLEKDPVEEVGRHWYVVRGEGMECVIDPPSSLGSATIKCYGREKQKLAGWINEYRMKKEKAA